jgi:uncharacterized membrane protein
VIRALFFALLCATPVFADNLPAHFSTKGIAADDTLNIRALPSASAEVIGEYGPYTLNIEVIRTTHDGKWGLVGMNEVNGWVAMRFLEISNHLQPNEFPRPMRCFGTEPFWTLNVTPRGDEYHEMGDTRRDIAMIDETTAPNGAMAVFEEGPTLNRTLIVQRGYCSDSMTEREFGWKATLFNAAPDGNSVQSGCCTLDANF